jgi:UDP-N-acetylmuramoylalanine--D-glutamate ligase
MRQVEWWDGLLRGEAFLASLKHARVVVVGLARQTAAATRLLREAGAEVRVEPAFTRADLTGVNLVVVTAGAAVDSPAVSAARAAGVTVLGELDLGWCATEADTLAVVGPGAPGAVRLAAAVLARQNREVVSAGTEEAGLGDWPVGVSPDGLILVSPSRAELATAQLFRPRVAVVMAGAGLAAKAALFANQTRRDCVVLDAEDADARRLAHETRAHVLWCSVAGALDHGVYATRGRIAARLNGHVEDISPVAGLPASILPAALAAVACALWAGMAPEAIGAALSAGRVLTPTVARRMTGGRAPLDLWTARGAALATT